MTRHWLIAPFGTKNAEMFDQVWGHDLANGRISIGWYELGDTFALDRAGLLAAVGTAFPKLPAATRSLYANMVWMFTREIKPGDIVIARRGRKVLAAVGDVTRGAYYSPGSNPILATPPRLHPNFIDVSWRASPRDLVFDDIVFPMHTLMEIGEQQYEELVEPEAVASTSLAAPEPTVSSIQFVLEKYLEEFIVSNFESIFGGKLKPVMDDEGVVGQQYPTEVGVIDILATEPSTQAYVVIELKKGRPSDQVVGQVLRYMGWVKEKLCKAGQPVKGLVICREPDQRLTYALSMTQNVQVKYYNVKFELRDDA
jgi:restriction system protein